jgi:hypothetical protein
MVRKSSPGIAAGVVAEREVLYGFRLNKNARGQSSPELNSQNVWFWNDRSWCQKPEISPKAKPLDARAVRFSKPREDTLGRLAAP